MYALSGYQVQYGFCRPLDTCCQVSSKIQYRLLKKAIKLLKSGHEMVYSTCSILKEENALDTIKSYGKKQVILFGIETHICVLQTAIELVKNGFEVYLIKNASKSRQDSEHLAGIDVMKSEGVNVVTLEIALFELLETSKNPSFKQVQALIK